MILAVLDDLFFSSKIRVAARDAGVEVVFARSAESVLAEARKTSPSLVILDLNSARTDPLATLSALKGDPAMASIPTVGFVSHVQVDVIRAAREAGVDEVFARSAFAERLSAILLQRER
jgi:PleD family two-component response regulator